MYDFWTIGCINGVHTLPHLKAWDERYRAAGLTVLSIHTSVPMSPSGGVVPT